MAPIRIHRHIDSDTLYLPELGPMVGKDVEIIVLERAANGGDVLDQLAAAQGVGPLASMDQLAGGWPAEFRDDGFEDDLRARRDEDLPREID